jgi:hypothetical protein
MTDKELIETLRGRNGFGWTEDAADRIEQLVEDNKSLAGAQESLVETLRESGCKRKEAEAKLAKAVEALGNIARQKKTEQIEAEGETEFSDFEGAYDMCIDVARAVLAQLEDWK